MPGKNLPKSAVARLDAIIGMWLGTSWHEALADPADRQRYIMLHPHPQILEPCHQKKAFHLHPRVKMCQMFGGG